MQALTREVLLDRAKALFADGTVDRAYGWKRGEFDYDVTPGLFRSVEEMEKEFVFDDFCGANFSKYLVEETRKGEGKILVFLKPCDTYSFNQLLTEHRFDREKVYAVGIPCEGMADVTKLKAEAAEGIRSITAEKEGFVVHTLYDGDKIIPRAEGLSERCLVCKSKKHVAYDELLGEDGEVADSARFDEVARLEAMNADERFAFWQRELSRCIRCNACRNVCPACYNKKSVLKNQNYEVEYKTPSNRF